MTKGGYATALSTFMSQVENGQDVTVTGDGRQERDFTHVMDVVAANLQAALALVSPEKETQSVIGAYNIGAGMPQQLMDIAIKITARAPWSTVTFIDARREPKKTHASNKKAEALLGWKPQYEFFSSLNLMLDEAIAQYDRQKSNT
jgi:UDP-glucose 4-epimerase